MWRPNVVRKAFAADNRALISVELSFIYTPQVAYTTPEVYRRKVKIRLMHSACKTAVNGHYGRVSKGDKYENRRFGRARRRDADRIDLAGFDPLVGVSYRFAELRARAGLRGRAQERHAPFGNRGLKARARQVRCSSEHAVQPRALFGGGDVKYGIPIGHEFCQ